MKLEMDVVLGRSSHGRRFELRAAMQTEVDRLVLFGPSGAGKTTTLQAIAGLLTPEQGRIVLNGRVLFDSERGIDVPSRDRDIGYLFQDYALFPHLSVIENVGFGLRRYPRPLSRAQKDQVLAVLAAFDLLPQARSLPGQLSGGQRQRVALARALVREPMILLLDEPFAALDSLLRERLRDELLEMQARLGIPWILISHDLEDVQVLGRSVALYDERGVSLMTPDRLLHGIRRGGASARAGIDASVLSSATPTTTNDPQEST